MVKPASFDKNGMKSGAWSEEEDNKLRAYISRFGHPNWRLLPLIAGLKRCGKSCRLRWVNYLKPGLRREKFTKDEERLIIELHNQLGNKWSVISSYFPGRTDNDIKNYWHAHIEKRRGGLSRSIRMQNLVPKEKSSSNDSGLNQDTPPPADSDYNNRRFADEEEFYGVEEDNIFSTLCDINISSSDNWRIASWSNLISDATVLPQPDFWSTEPVGPDFFNNIQFW